jgi:subtilisin family serine protease
MTGRFSFRIALALCLAALALLQPAAASARQPMAAPADRQILVMVRQLPDHYRPNSAYDGAYGDQIGRSVRERLARQIARKYDLSLLETWPMPMIGVDCFIMAVPDGRSTTTTVDQIAHDRDVDWAEPVGLYKAQSAAASPNDPLYAAQPAAREWHLADLHRLATGRGVKVAVIDSGIEATHPDLAGQLLVNRNFVSGQAAVSEAHGTGVAGIIAAKSDNHLGIAGIAPDARLLGLRACWQRAPASTATTVCDTLSLAKALYFAIEQNADVINLSLTGPDDRLLRELLKVALAHGSAVVTAFDTAKADGGFPASVPGVIAVSDMLVAPSRGSVYTAPGDDVPTTQPGGRWFLVNGSSYAAAHVSGLVALVRERRRSARIWLVSARSGGGTIDACATLIRVVGRCDCACTGYRVASAALER